ncbi:MAG TPA: hypothetical protein ENH62_17490 [Marinobacter sp.]|uniref:Uncharacterized protein n=1 Tax=marine sediment metagenome TaxID=412755 RepID=A0A0F9KVS3_9ZZZZ|nr:hypothetical protein [Marinobacter sp.]
MTNPTPNSPEFAALTAGEQHNILESRAIEADTISYADLFPYTDNEFLDNEFLDPEPASETWITAAAEAEALKRWQNNTRLSRCSEITPFKDLTLRGEKTMNLDDIAAEMTRACHNMFEDNDTTFCISQRTLPRGLILTLELSGSHWQLGLNRANIEPSEAEVDTCARDFDIPKGTAATRGVAALGNGKIIYVARLRWPREQPTLLKE